MAEQKDEDSNEGDAEDDKEFMRKLMEKDQEEEENKDKGEEEKGEKDESDDKDNNDSDDEELNKILKKGTTAKKEEKKIESLVVDVKETPKKVEIPKEEKKHKDSEASKEGDEDSKEDEKSSDEGDKKNEELEDEVAADPLVTLTKHIFHTRVQVKENLPSLFADSNNNAQFDLKISRMDYVKYAKIEALMKGGENEKLQGNPTCFTVRNSSDYLIIDIQQLLCHWKFSRCN